MFENLEHLPNCKLEKTLKTDQNSFLPKIFISICFGCSNELIETVLLITHNICVLGAQKNRLIEIILLSTHNICID